MTIPTDFDQFIKPQSVRKSALQSQLSALDCQLRVIKALSLEHSLGVEDSGDAEFLLGQARDLVASSQAVAERAGKVSKDTTLKSLRALRDMAIEIQNRANVLDKDALSRARMRLDHCLSEHAGITTESVAGHVPADCDSLAVKAGVTCCNAESEQFKTFAMQIAAVCDLALEFAYNSALESPAFKSNQS